MSLRTPLITPLRDPDWFFGIWPWAKGPLFRLEEDWTFAVWDGEKHAIYTIPKGYEFDKASVPSVFWGAPFNYLPDGLCTTPALEHDFLCDLLTGGVGPKYQELLKKTKVPSSFTAVHKHFYDRLLAYGVRPAKAKAIWEAVRKFGPGSWIRPSTWTR